MCTHLHPTLPYLTLHICCVTVCHEAEGEARGRRGGAFSDAGFPCPDASLAPPSPCQLQLDPELELYAMPQRDLVRSDEDIKILVENFPEKTRATFLDWYEGYKLQVPPHGQKVSGLEKGW